MPLTRGHRRPPGAHHALLAIMDGGEGTDVTRVLLEAAYPGGLLVSWMAGAAF